MLYTRFDNNSLSNGGALAFDLPDTEAEYGVHRLVYYEIYSDRHEAITREKRIKLSFRSNFLN